MTMIDGGNSHRRKSKSKNSQKDGFVILDHQDHDDFVGVKSVDLEETDTDPPGETSLFLNESVIRENDDSNDSDDSDDDNHGVCMMPSNDQNQQERHDNDHKHENVNVDSSEEEEEEEEIDNNNNNTTLINDCRRIVGNERNKLFDDMYNNQESNTGFEQQQQQQQGQAAVSEISNDDSFSERTTATTTTGDGEGEGERGNRTFVDPSILERDAPELYDLVTRALPSIDISIAELKSGIYVGELITKLYQVIQNAKDLQGLSVALLTGPTRAGKSTTVNYLDGKKLFIRSDLNRRFLVLQDDEIALPGSEIGHTGRSKTDLVSIHKITFKENRRRERTITIIDTPGYFDTGGPMVDIPNSIGISNCLKNCKEVKLVFLLAYKMIDDKYIVARDMPNIVTSMKSIFTSEDALKEGLSKSQIWFTQMPPGESISAKDIYEERMEPLCDEEEMEKEEVRKFFDEILLAQMQEEDIKIVDPIINDEMNEDGRIRLLKNLASRNKVITEPDEIFENSINSESKNALQKLVTQLVAYIHENVRNNKYNDVLIILKTLKVLYDMTTQEFIKNDTDECITKVVKELALRCDDRKREITEQVKSEQCLTLSKESLERFKKCLDTLSLADSFIQQYKQETGFYAETRDTMLQFIQEITNDLSSDLNEKISYFSISSSSDLNDDDLQLEKNITSVKILLDKFQIISTFFSSDDESLNVKYIDICKTSLDTMSKQMKPADLLWNDQVDMLKSFEPYGYYLSFLKRAKIVLEDHLPDKGKNYQALYDEAQHSIYLYLKNGLQSFDALLDAWNLDDAKRILLMFQEVTNVNALKSHCTMDDLDSFFKSALEKIVSIFNTLFESCMQKMENEGEYGFTTIEEDVKKIKGLYAISTNVQHETFEKYQNVMTTLMIKLDEVKQNAILKINSILNIDDPNQNFRGSSQCQYDSLADLVSVLQKCTWVDDLRLGISIINLCNTIDETFLNFVESICEMITNAFSNDSAGLISDIPSIIEEINMIIDFCHKNDRKDLKLFIVKKRKEVNTAIYKFVEQKTKSTSAVMLDRNSTQIIRPVELRELNKYVSLLSMLSKVKKVEDICIENLKQIKEFITNHLEIVKQIILNVSQPDFQQIKSFLKFLQKFKRETYPDLMKLFHSSDLMELKYSDDDDEDEVFFDFVQAKIDLRRKWLKETEDTLEEPGTQIREHLALKLRQASRELDDFYIGREETNIDSGPFREMWISIKRSLQQEVDTNVENAEKYIDQKKFSARTKTFFEELRQTQGHNGETFRNLKQYLTNALESIMSDGIHSDFSSYASYHISFSELIIRNARNLEALSSASQHLSDFIEDYQKTEIDEIFSRFINYIDGIYYSIEKDKKQFCFDGMEEKVEQIRIAEISLRRSTKLRNCCITILNEIEEKLRKEIKNSVESLLAGEKKDFSLLKKIYKQLHYLQIKQNVIYHNSYQQIHDDILEAVLAEFRLKRVIKKGIQEAFNKDSDIITKTLSDMRELISIISYGTSIYRSDNVIDFSCECLKNISNCNNDLDDIMNEIEGEKKLLLQKAVSGSRYGKIDENVSLTTLKRHHREQYEQIVNDCHNVSKDCEIEIEKAIKETKPANINEGYSKISKYNVSITSDETIGGTVETILMRLAETFIKKLQSVSDELRVACQQYKNQEINDKASIYLSLRKTELYSHIEKAGDNENTCNLKKVDEDFFGTMSQFFKTLSFTFDNALKNQDWSRMNKMIEMSTNFKRISDELYQLNRDTAFISMEENMQNKTQKVICENLEMADLNWKDFNTWNENREKGEKFVESIQTIISYLKENSNTRDFDTEKKIQDLILNINSKRKELADEVKKDYANKNFKELRQNYNVLKLSETIEEILEIIPEIKDQQYSKSFTETESYLSEKTEQIVKDIKGYIRDHGDELDPVQLSQQFVELKSIGTEMPGAFQTSMNKELDDVMKACNKNSRVIMQKVGLLLADLGPIGRDVVDNSDIFQGFAIKNFKRLTGEHGFDQILRSLKGDDLDFEKLKSIYGVYNNKYKEVLDKYLRPNPDYKQIVLECKSLVNRDKKVDGWNKQLQMDIIPNLLGYIFATWTIYYGSATFFDAKSDRECLMQPHDAQILSILRLVSSDSHEKLENHLIEIGTGEGKSITLGITSILLAILGFDVDCVCYSDMLRSRDYSSFEKLFKLFEVDGNIRYDTFEGLAFDTFCNRDSDENICELSTRFLETTNNIQEPSMLGRVGNYVSSSIIPQSVRRSYRSSSRRQKIILIDEVDVFFSKSFYGQLFHPAGALKDESICNLIRHMWKNRRVIQNLSQLIDTEEYKTAITKFEGSKFLIKGAAISLLRTIEHFEKEPKKYSYIVINDKLAYKLHDTYSSDINYGFFTMVSYLFEHESGKISEQGLNSNLYISVNCASFSFAEIPKSYKRILGVTGTLESLTRPEKDVVEGFYKIRKQSYIPSMFSTANRDNIFHSASDVTLVRNDGQMDEETVKANKHLEIRNQINQIMQNYQEGTRAVIVFFEDKENLLDFTKSTHYQMLNNNMNIKSVNRILEETNDEDKKIFIKKAATSGTVTLATRSFGRGVDFICRDDTLLSNGGMHVLLTFYCLDYGEEIQIKGRTARQGQKGTFSMLFSDQDLFRTVGIEKEKLDTIHSNNENLYEHLKEIRESQATDLFKTRQEAIGIAKKEHDITEQAMKLLIAPDSWNENKDFLKKYFESRNSKYKELKNGTGKSRTIILMDATGSMYSLLQKSKDTVVEFFGRITRVLEEHQIHSGFSLQFAVYSNYNVDQQLIFENSNWESSGDPLKQYMSTINVRGGMGSEAIEIGLHHVNKEAEKDEVSQVILIGDAGPNSTGNGSDSVTAKRRRSRFDWDNIEGFKEPTDYIKECNLLREKDIPVHCFYIEQRAKQGFEQIAQLTNGHVNFLDVNNHETGSQDLTDVVSKQILENIGGEELVLSYEKMYKK